MPLIELQHLTKQFPTGNGFFTALKDITLSFGEGEFAGLVGPSGSGKTTLLNIIGSLDVPTAGSARVMGQPVGSLTHRQAADLRNHHIGFIFQTYNLLPVYTVYQNVEFALLLQKRNDAQRRTAVCDALEWVGLTDKMHSKPAQLSGGECQRVAIARAMVKRPSIVLADEPSANLDAENSHHILQTMQALNRDLHTTFIFATHDEKVMHYLQRIITLRDGVVENDQWHSPSPHQPPN
ncbi:putative ABC transport system ATP-binding protein [Breznakibacter xylanolyticus]|uniref:Putative ABC transport system ATP-binding protein n=1 Tax=Breznakibacter xylanolyticus TaxID=990 RepID=A0A2W7NJ61_9BACT|nr:ABC transporter ATP-binding protein [Breznakibacter xylanolyticus]MBN2743645.1 ABC transporter ATP-binding protein [Marinilabiliaceae bacterium]PZX20288.1 putative ABC transport system ATP-binding protein [Breznakibacter xylanolyticus]